MGIEINPPTDWRTGSGPIDLFIRFAMLKTDPVSIQAFAERYGTLDGGTEPIEKWQEEIANMNAAVRLWLDIERARGRKIDDTVPAIFPPTAKPDADTGMEADLLSGWPEDIADRYAALHSLVRQGIGQRVGVSFWAIHNDLTFVVQPEGKALGGRLWLRLSEAVSERWKLRACHHCGIPFRLTDPRGMYCSQACKVAASRARSKK